MGGLLHLFEFNHADTSQKFMKHKRHEDGLEAPRNSLELPLETSQSYDAFCENIPYAFQVKQNAPKRHYFPGGAPMKDLIDKEITKEPETRRQVPSVVARLMGMDMLPSEATPPIHIKGKVNEMTGNSFPRKEQNGSIRRSPLGLKTSKQTEYGALSHSRERDTFEKPQPREHPQEEQLQKFKKEFEAWQAARVWENSKIADLSNIPRQWLAQEHLNKEKMALYAGSRRNTAKEKPTEHKVHNSQPTLKSSPQEESVLRRHDRRDMLLDDRKEHKVHNSQHTLKSSPQEESVLRRHDRRDMLLDDRKEHRVHNSQPVLKSSPQEESVLRRQDRRDMLLDERKERATLRSRTSEFEQVTLMTHAEKQDKSDIPTRIVILKPGPDRYIGSEASWTGSSEFVEEEGSIHDFLEEVKERLRFEMQGMSTKRENVVRGGGIETPFSEKASNPKQIARHIAKQVRESVTRDLGMNLLRSESTRSYISEIQVNGPDSPEFINRDTRKFLSERLRNVLKAETHMDIPTVVGGSSRASMADKEERRRRPIEDVWKTLNKGNHWENVQDDLEMQSRSFRQGLKNDDRLQMGDRSPRSLIRSLSAPVSGTSFGKLLLEDRHILTGGHIRRRHESNENVSVEVRKTRKERFNFRGKVSNFRYRFNFKSKLFGRKIQSVDDTRSYESDSMSDIMSGRIAMMNVENSLENSTEVPPSPASVCSSPHDEYWRAGDHPSPISTLDTPSIEDLTVPQVFRDISSNLHELRRKINKLGLDSSEDKVIEEDKPLEAEMVGLEDHAEVYVRDILVISGLYDGSFNWSFSRWDPYSKPIANWVFEKVEESYKKRAEETGTTEDDNESEVQHKVLFDLVNESLATILGPSLTTSKFKRKIIGHAKMPPPRGKKLLDVVWRMICMYVNPACDGSFYSLDAMVTRDLGIFPWWGMKNDDEDIDLIGREMEGWILSELIEEIVKDMKLL